jgi:hypothetical protein
MKAYLTFIRKSETDIHMIGLKNPDNITILNDVNLKSGQPILVVIDDNIIQSFYLLDKKGTIHQVKGTVDRLFDLDVVHDLTTINIKKYNTIKSILISTFYCASIEESKYHKNVLIELENKIFYDLLHIEIEIYKLKKYIIKELSKFPINKDLKTRLIEACKNTKIPNRRFLRKKIDLDLSGYRIKINTQIN